MKRPAAGPPLRNPVTITFQVEAEDAAYAALLADRLSMPNAGFWRWLLYSLERGHLRHTSRNIDSDIQRESAELDARRLGSKQCSPRATRRKLLEDVADLRGLLGVGRARRGGSAA